MKDEHSNAAPRWLYQLQKRWKLKSLKQVLVVLVVFSCTGFTVFFIKKPILEGIAGGSNPSTLANILYYVFILPLYNIILLFYGFILGQFHFFWEFEKRFFRKVFFLKKD